MGTQLNNDRGFTLVEIVIALLLAGLVTGAMYNVYTSQNKAYVAQEQVVETQQNLRASIYMMKREIRMSGYNPLRAANVGILTASASQLRITMDITGGEGNGLDDDMDGISDEANGESDGSVDDPNEDITYSLSDAEGDGDLDLIRTRNDLNPARDELLAENIDALDFVYLDAGDNVLARPVPAANLGNIRSVQITLVARARKSDPDYTDNNIYRNQNPDGAEVIFPATAIPPGDNFRRKRLTTDVNCRNLWSS